MDLNPGEGQIIDQNNEKVAVYKDASGAVSAVSAICTHQGCTVGWNANDKTWDCPCHGSRFDTNGTVVKGPAAINLPKRLLEE
jgi:Rieske Fe-S protein